MNQFVPFSKASSNGSSERVEKPRKAENENEVLLSSCLFNGKRKCDFDFFFSDVTKRVSERNTMKKGLNKDLRCCL